jgi:predicted nucleic acid-binding protein
LEEGPIVADAVLAAPLIVVDTDVVSFLFRRDMRAERYRPHLADRIRVISAQTSAELYLWPEVRNWEDRRRRELERFLRDYAVEYPDDEICRRYAELTAESLRRGLTLPVAALERALGTRRPHPGWIHDSPRLPNLRRRRTLDSPLHRGRVQPQAASFLAGLPIARRVRDYLLCRGPFNALT